VELQPRNGFKSANAANLTAVGDPKSGNNPQRAAMQTIRADDSIQQTRPNQNMGFAR
jgi:hypothetical protein